jgi:cytochrome c peroxidase
MNRLARAVTFSALGALPFGLIAALAADVHDPSTLPVATSYWIAPGQVGSLPARARYHDGVGDVEVLFGQGSVDLRGNAFFAPLGSNGRACVTCHQPGSGMGLSVETIRRRWQETQGKDPLFAAIDGSNCPSLPQDEERTHSLLLKRGLFRVSLPWPRTTGPDGSPVDPEFTIEVVRDPTGCNTDPKYGLNSPDPHISVYRRPRVVANLKYLAVDAGAQIFGAAGPFNAKRLGMVMDRDPDTGRYSAMNIMSDAREPSLKLQARDASVDHLQVQQPLTDQQLQSIVSFESQVYAAQGTDLWGDDFSLASAPPSLGARNLQQSPSGVLGDNFGNPAFKSFESWQQQAPSISKAQASFRDSVIRGYDVFFNRPFWIRDVTHINTVGLGNPAKRTCVTCHNLQMVGTDASAGWGDLGTTNEPWADAAISSPTYEAQRPDLPLFKVVCKPEARPHPFLGRVIFTHDPGRALISGKCYDVGSIVMGQLRALAARPPYFASGSAEDLRAVVDYYDRRFNIGLSVQERADLVNFLSVL